MVDVDFELRKKESPIAAAIGTFLGWLFIILFFGSLLYKMFMSVFS